MKIGDLAIVINSLDVEHIGMVVELLEDAGKCRAYFDGSEWAGYQDETGLQAWRVSICSTGTTGYAFERNLMPLRGDEQTSPAKREELTV